MTVTLFIDFFCVAIVRSSDAGSGSIVPETRFRVYGKMNYVIVGFSLCFGRNFCKYLMLLQNAV